MGWLIALGVLTALAILPLGASVRYDEGGPLVRLILGPIRLTVFPRPKKEKKTEPKQGKKKPEEKPAEKKQPKPVPKQEAKPASAQNAKEPKGGSWKEFLPLIQVALDMLGSFRRKLRVNDLELKLTMAGDDPCDLAVNYGRAWAAIGSLMPQLERLFVIKKRNVEVQCDFTASETTIFARLDLTITLGRILSLAAVYGFRALKEFLTIRKKRKGGAVK